MGKKLPFLLILFLAFSASLFASSSGLPNPIEVDITGVNPSCPGVNDGSAMAIATGGWEPYVYEWNTGETTQTITGLGPGTYIVTVTDIDLAFAIDTITLTTDSIEWVTNANYETCTGSCDATAGVVSVTGGKPPYTYQWSDPAGTTTWVAENLCAGIYFITITDMNGCSTVADVVVELSPEGVWVMSSSTDVTCFGFSDGTAYVGAMTGTPPYTYEWSDPSIPPVNDPDGLGPGKYFVTVTDLNGCTAIDSVTVAEPPLLEIDLDITDFDCGSGGSGSITAAASGGTPPYSYVWSTGAGGPILSGLNTGSYTVTVTDANDCTATATGEITGANPDAGTLTITADSVCLIGGSATLSATPNGDAEVPPGYSLIYVLTSGAGLIIEQTAPDPEFTVTELGLYTIHTLVYDPATLDLSIIVPGVTPASAVNDLLVQGGGDICAALDVTGAEAEVVECCEAEAGALSADAEACLATDEVTLSATPDGSAVVPPGYQVVYVLTSGAGLIIVDTNTDPEFTVSQGGLYTIHTLVYDPNTLDLGIVIPGVTTGFDVNALLLQGGGDICAALDVAGAPIEVINPDAGSLTADSSEVCLVDGMAVISATVNQAANIPAGYERVYVLTSGAGLVIEQVGFSPEFTVSSLGLYTIHTLVYDPNTLDLGSIDIGTTTGFDVNGLLVQGGGDICASLDVSGAPQQVVECFDCIDIGDFVWYDYDGDGLQSGNDQGVEYFQVLLTTAGPDGAFGTGDDVIEDIQFTDALGYYLFECVEPGEYVIVFNPFGIPDNYEFTHPNQGSDDELDSDADTLTGATPPFTVIDGQNDDLSFDAGLDIICIPLYDGGEIGYSQVICEGTVPDELVNLVTPGIGLADVEYLWMFTTLPGIPFNPSTWEIVPNSFSANYQPGALTQTTFYIRCARYEGCEEYTAESNIIVIEVLPLESPECAYIFQSIQGSSNPEDGLIALQWSVSSVQDDYEFIVEKSGNDIDYDPVGKVMAEEVQEGKTFSFVDRAPRAGANYYRIVLMSEEGEMEISEVQKVLYRMPKFSIFPNPFVKDLTVDSRRMIEQPVQLTLYNMLGKPVHTQQHPGQDRLNLVMNLESLSEGIYFLEIRYSETRAEVFRVLKTSRER